MAKLSIAVYNTQGWLEYVIPFEQENPINMDQHDDVSCYPRVRASTETKGPIVPLFATHNVIDGILSNAGHWP